MNQPPLSGFIGQSQMAAVFGVWIPDSDSEFGPSPLIFAGVRTQFSNSMYPGLSCVAEGAWILAEVDHRWMWFCCRTVEPWLCQLKQVSRTFRRRVGFPIQGLWMVMDGYGGAGPISELWLVVSRGLRSPMCPWSSLILLRALEVQFDSI